MLNHVRVVAAILPLAVMLGGCLFEGTVDDKGAAELKMHYRIAPNITIERAAKDLESKDVKLVSKSLDKDSWIDATVQTADVSKLSTAPFFKAWSITLADGKDKGTKSLAARYMNKVPNAKIPQSGIDYYGDQIKVVLTLPGVITRSNATESKGNSATWVWNTQDFFKSNEIPIEVTYEVGK